MHVGRRGDHHRRVLATQGQQGMQVDGGLGPSKSGPREDLVVAAIPRDALVKFVLGEEIQPLGENGATLIHGSGFRVNLQPKSTNWPLGNSNRKNVKTYF